jgi:hypothetical protein
MRTQLANVLAQTRMLSPSRARALSLSLSPTHTQVRYLKPLMQQNYQPPELSSLGKLTYLTYYTYFTSFTHFT